MEPLTPALSCKQAIRSTLQADDGIPRIGRILPSYPTVRIAGIDGVQIKCISVREQGPDPAPKVRQFLRLQPYLEDRPLDPRAI